MNIETAAATTYSIAYHTSTTSQLKIEDDLKLAKATGYDGVICNYSKLTDYLNPAAHKDLKALMKETGASIFGISNIPVNMKKITEQTLATIQKAAQLNKAVKGNFISISPTAGSRHPGSEEAAVEDLAGKLGQMADAAGEYGVKLAVEAEKTDSLLSSPVKLTYIISRSARENIGFVFDTFAYKRAGISLEELETIERYFYAVYLADVPEKKSLKETDRTLLGEGVLDFEKILRVIGECEYQGVFAVKLFTDFRTKNKIKTLLKNARENILAFLDIITHI